MTGTIIYFNGMSGWIRQEGVSDLPTSQSNDVIFLAEDVASGTPALGASVSFSAETDMPWMAYGITVS